MKHLKFDSELRNLIAKAGFTTHKRDPKPVKVKVYLLYIENGQVQKRFMSDKEVMPPFRELTQAEYEEELKDILGDIPQEFLPVANYLIVDTSSREDALAIIQDFVDELCPCVEAYCQRVTRKTR